MSWAKDKKRALLKGRIDLACAEAAAFIDAQVEEEHLLVAGDALVETGAGKTGALLSVERLAENARDRAASLRPQVDRELSRFCKASTQADFSRLFKRVASQGALS